MTEAEKAVREGVFYVESTSAWRRLADLHLGDGGATGALAGALYTLVDAYEHARARGLEIAGAGRLDV